LHVLFASRCRRRRALTKSGETGRAPERAVLRVGRRRREGPREPAVQVDPHDRLRDVVVARWFSSPSGNSRSSTCSASVTSSTMRRPVDGRRTGAQPEILSVASVRKSTPRDARSPCHVAGSIPSTGCHRAVCSGSLDGIRPAHRRSRRGFCTARRPIRSIRPMPTGACHNQRGEPRLVLTGAPDRRAAAGSGPQ
jgi:hypothetical protein